jgi:hypothetical protein
MTEEPPAMPCDASRRTAIITAVEAHNRAHPTARLPRPAARLLAVMFADQDVCCVSQLALQAEGFGKTLPSVLRALVATGFVSKQTGAPTPHRRGTPPDTYRLHLPEMAQ